jgi:hypothetical protein
MRLFYISLPREVLTSKRRQGKVDGMAVLGSPHGIFRLDDSDHCVGSFFLKSDVKEILHVDDDDLQNIGFVHHNGDEIIDERDIQKAWYNEQIPNAPPSRNGNSKISFNNPEHPIIERIRKGKKDIKTILPRGYADIKYWAPEKLYAVCLHTATGGSYERVE